MTTVVSSYRGTLRLNQRRLRALAVSRHTQTLQGEAARLGRCSRMTSECSAILRGIEGHSVGDSAEQAIALRPARLILTPLSPLDEAEHARASGNSDDALRDTRAAELQWREHGFGPWAIRDVGDNSFLGAAELRFAGDGY